MAGESLDCILCCGDALYKKVKTNNDFLQVHEIGKEIYDFGQTFKSPLEMNTMEHYRKMK